MPRINCAMVAPVRRNVSASDNDGYDLVVVRGGIYGASVARDSYVTERITSAVEDSDAGP